MTSWIAVLCVCVVGLVACGDEAKPEPQGNADGGAPASKATGGPAPTATGTAEKQPAGGW